MKLKTGVFTIASKNYLAYVRVLLRSIEQVHPEYQRWLCLADRPDGHLDMAAEPYRVVLAQDLGIADFADMALRYDIMEFNTAVKPSVVRWLFANTDLDVVIYLDPDIRVYSRFDDIEAAFERGASSVLTPHITRPLEDGKDPHDHHMLQAGVFNLGFAAFRRVPEAEAFVGWWSRRLATQAVADVRANLFTDQRWCDLAPCFLDKLHVLKSPGYNVAYWNLAERQISRDAQGSWQVNGRALAFFHFSGVNVDRPNLVSKHQNRYTWDNLAHVRPLFEDYFDGLRRHGSGELKVLPYAYGELAGLRVPTIVRMLFRECHPQPMAGDEAHLAAALVRLCRAPAELPECPGAPPISRLAHLVHRLRPDLQAVFNLGDAEGRRQFLGWFATSAVSEYNLPAALVPAPAAQVHAAPPPPAAMVAAPRSSPPPPPAAAASAALLDGLAAGWGGMSPAQRLQVAPLLLGLLSQAPAHGAVSAAAAPAASAVAPGPAPGQLRAIDSLRTAADLPVLAGDPGITRLMYLVWKSRADLQEAFDLKTASSRASFRSWFSASAGPEYGISDEPLVPADATRHGAWISPAALGGEPGANLVGYAHAELGMGEHVRMSAAALSTTEVRHGVVNFAVKVRSRQSARLEHGELIEGSRYRANIFHVNADQMLSAYAQLGRPFFNARYNIGYWAWELARCPEAWVPIMETVHEIWAPSRFIQQAFAAVTDIPVVHMPLCVAPGRPAALPRAHFGLPEGRFLFLYVFDFLSFLERKNPQAAVRAFQRAFPRDDHSAGLVLKVMNAHIESPAWRALAALIDGDPRIVVIDSTMDRAEVLALFAACDSFVSLHRAEGFGRGPAEAMYLGKPVIATNYSGNTDFTLPDNACLVDYRLVPVPEGQYPMAQGQVWADADIEHAAWHMRRLVDDPARASELGQRGRQLMLEKFSDRAVGALYQRRLREIGVV